MTLISGSETSSSAESPSDIDYEVTSDSLDTEQSTVSSPEDVKDKCSKHKIVRKLKHKKKKVKVEYDSSEDESSDIPKKKRKVKKLRKGPKLKKHSERKESKSEGRKHQHTAICEHKQCVEPKSQTEKDNVENINIGAIRTVTGSGWVSVDVNEWVRLMEYVQ